MGGGVAIGGAAPCRSSPVVGQFLESCCLIVPFAGWGSVCSFRLLQSMPGLTLLIGPLVLDLRLSGLVGWAHSVANLPITIAPLTYRGDEWALP